MGVTEAVTLLLALLDRAAAISALIAKAQAEGRPNLTPDEWKQITDSDDAARAELVAAIAAAK